jgi:tetratricopeptide (TPR) repeat protein
MNVYRWGNMNKKGIFVDNNNSFTLAIVLNVRNMHARLAEELISAGRNEDAVAVLDSAMARIPAYNFPLNISTDSNDLVIMNIIQLYYRLGETAKADAMAKEFVDLTEKNLVFFSKLRDGGYDLELNLSYMQQMGSLLAPYNEALSMQAKQRIEFYLTKLGYDTN